MMTDKPNKSASKLFVTARKKTLSKDKVFFQWNSPFGEWNRFAMKYANAYEIFASQMLRANFISHFSQEKYFIRNLFRISSCNARFHYIINSRYQIGCLFCFLWESCCGFEPHSAKPNIIGSASLRARRAAPFESTRSHQEKDDCESKSFLFVFVSAGHNIILQL